MAALTDHDRRQVGRIAERLELFTKGELSLRVLIADLEFLLSALEAIETNARQDLRGKWEVLEEVYSVAVGMHDGNLDEYAKSLVRDAVVALRVHVEKLLAM